MDLTINMNNKFFPEFVNKLQELTQIGDVLKIKIQSDKTLMYSAKSVENSVLALKSFLIDTTNIFENFKSDEPFDLIILNSVRFVKNLKFIDSNKPIKMSMNYRKKDGVMHIRNVVFSNGKLKITTVGGEMFKIRDINKETLAQRLNPLNSKFKFKVSNRDLSDIKKLSSICSEEKVINIDLRGGTIIVHELGKWELEVDNVDYQDTSIIFGKKYLSNMNMSDDEIFFSVFDTFILVSHEDSNFMMSFEQTFEED